MLFHFRVHKTVGFDFSTDDRIAHVLEVCLREGVNLLGQVVVDQIRFVSSLKFCEKVQNIRGRLDCHCLTQVLERQKLLRSSCIALQLNEPFEVI